MVAPYGKDFSILEYVKANRLNELESGESVILFSSENGIGKQKTFSREHEDVYSSKELIGGFLYVEFVFTGYCDCFKPMWIVTGNESNITITRLECKSDWLEALGDDFSYDEYGRWGLVCDKLSSMDIDKIHP